MRIITGKGSLVREYIKTLSKDFFENNLYNFPENGCDIEEQANYINFLQKNENIEDITIFTFSPYIISDISRENVFIVQEDLSLRNPDFNTFGAAANKISFNLFRKSTIGQTSLDKINYFSNNIKISTFDEIDKTLGESINKVFLTRQLFLFEDKKSIFNPIINIFKSIKKGK